MYKKNTTLDDRISPKVK